MIEFLMVLKKLTFHDTKFLLFVCRNCLNTDSGTFGATLGVENVLDVVFVVVLVLLESFI